MGKEWARTIADYGLWFLNKYLKGSNDPLPPLANYPRILGQPGTMTYTDTNAAGSARLFYRVGVR